MPFLLRYEPWGLTPTEAGLIGSYALIGMLVGALVAGAVTDLVGRRKVLLVSVSWFSLTMAACAIAPSAELFGLFRLLGGLGLGGVMPTAIALTAEYSAAHRRSLTRWAASCPPYWPWPCCRHSASGSCSGSAAPVMYALVAVAGFGTIGTQIMVNAYVAMHFPPEVRATALGWTLGIGRLGAVVGPTFGGILLASDLAVEWNFHAFAIPAAIGAFMVFLLPKDARAAAAPAPDTVAVRA